MRRLVFVLVACIAIVLVGRAILFPSAPPVAQADQPICKVLPMSGKAPARACDMAQLCIAFNKESDDYNRTFRTLKDKPYYDEKLDEHSAKMYALGARLKAYAPADLEKWCHLSPSRLVPVNSPTSARDTLALAYPKDSSCASSPSAQIPLGEPIAAGQLAALLAAACPGAYLDADLASTVIWSGKQYRIQARKHVDGGTVPMLEVVSVKAMQ